MKFIPLVRTKIDKSLFAHPLLVPPAVLHYEEHRLPHGCLVRAWMQIDGSRVQSDPLRAFPADLRCEEHWLPHGSLVQMWMQADAG